MKLRALDTLLVSSVKSDNLKPNEEFEIDDAAGAKLVERGYAVEVKAAKKAAPKPGNKMAKAPGNKASGTRAKKGR